MSSLTIVGMIGYFVIGYLLTSTIVTIMFIMIEWYKMGQPDDLDFHDLMQISLRLMGPFRPADRIYNVRGLCNLSAMADRQRTRLISTPYRQRWAFCSALWSRI